MKLVPGFLKSIEIETKRFDQNRRSLDRGKFESRLSQRRQSGAVWQELRVLCRASLDRKDRDPLTRRRGLTQSLLEVVDGRSFARLVHDEQARQDAGPSRTEIRGRSTRRSRSFRRIEFPRRGGRICSVRPLNPNPPLLFSLLRIFSIVEPVRIYAGTRKFRDARLYGCIFDFWERQRADLSL